MNFSTSNKEYIPVRKKWGQNFLIDNNVIDKIIKVINPSIDDIIIEIGPGNVLSGLAKRSMPGVSISQISSSEDLGY